MGNSLQFHSIFSHEVLRMKLLPRLSEQVGGSLSCLRTLQQYTWLSGGCSLWHFKCRTISLRTRTPCCHDCTQNPHKVDWNAVVEQHYSIISSAKPTAFLNNYIYNHFVNTKILVRRAVGFGLWKPRASHLSNRGYTPIKSEFCHTSKNHNKSLMSRYSLDILLK